MVCLINIFERTQFHTSSKSLAHVRLFQNDPKKYLRFWATRNQQNPSYGQSKFINSHLGQLLQYLQTIHWFWIPCLHWRLYQTPWVRTQWCHPPPPWPGKTPLLGDHYETCHTSPRDLWARGINTRRYVMKKGDNVIDAYFMYTGSLKPQITGRIRFYAVKHLRSYGRF